jgi:tight adherence protein B
VTAALVALACALLVAPTRRRVVTRGLPELRYGRRWRAAGLVLAGMAAAIVLPVGVVVAVAIVGGTATLRMRRARMRSRRADEATALQAALDVLAGELRAGAHPVVAFETAATEVPDDVSAALRAVAARARLGVDVGTGLRSAATGSTVPSYWDRLAVCWDMAHRHGLAIALLMRTAHRDLVERARFESRVSAGMAGPRATAGVLAVLPVVGIALGQLVGADPVSFLLSGGFGGWLLAVGATLSCGGLLWSDRITARTLT